MARTYTLHVPRDTIAGEPAALERAEFVRDGFSWGAFVFTALWFFWHRAWAVGVALLIALIAFAAGLRILAIHPGAAVAAMVLVHLLIGLEAASLRRWALARRGKPAIDAVAAADLDEAEAKTFTRFLARNGSSGETVRASQPAAFPGRYEPVLGLFPDAERSR